MGTQARLRRLKNPRGTSMKLRTLLFLGLAAALLLPDPPPDDPLMQTAAAQARPPADANAAELALAAMAAASDAGSFCQRQPQACDVANRYWQRFKLRLRYAVRLVYEWANDAPPAAPAKAGAPESDTPAVPERAGEEMTPPKSRPEEQVRQQQAAVLPASQGLHAHLRLTLSAVDDIVTGSTTPMPPRVTNTAQRRSGKTGDGSENTLTIEDIIVPWNGPRTASG